MNKKFGIAVLVAITLDLLVTGYGVVAAGQEAQAVCSQELGSVVNHECVKGGHDLFHVPL